MSPLDVDLPALTPATCVVPQGHVTGVGEMLTACVYVPFGARADGSLSPVEMRF